MSRKLLVGTVLLAAGVVSAVFGLTSPKPVYARTVSEFLAKPIYGQPARVQGVLVRGSLCRESAGCGYRFRIADDQYVATDAGPAPPSPELSVHYPQCLIPDTFRDVPGLDVHVSVEGELCANCHRFEASQIMARCPAVYRTGKFGDNHPMGRPTASCSQPESPSRAHE